MQQLIGDLFMQAFANPAGGAGGSGAPRSGGARRQGTASPSPPTAT
ncbi:hypothetical protein M3O75_19315 [Klebsiella pneumoniae]|nr:hypothetical protein [Klebsiella pneumoniae]